MADLKTIYKKQPGTYTSSQYLTAIADTTGTGNLVFADSPQLTGTPTASEPDVSSNDTTIATTNFVNLKASGIQNTDEFNYVSLSGTSQTLNLNNGNFFDGGTLTGDTTVTFTNIPAGISKWTYTFETGWDVTDATNVVYTGSYDTTSEEINPRGVYFRQDGYGFYITGIDGDEVNQYRLTYKWDVTRGVVHQGTFSLSSYDSLSQGLYFDKSGTRMYFVGFATTDLYQFSLNRPWDVTNGVSFVASTDILEDPGNSQVTGLFFKPDGTKFYILGNGLKDIREYTLNTPWQLSSGKSNTGTYSINELFNNTMYGLTFDNTGTKFYITDTSTSDIRQFKLDTAWDISSTVTYQGNHSTGAEYTGNEHQLVWGNGGSSLYVITDNFDRVHQYSILNYKISLPTSVRNFDYSAIKPGRNTLEFYTVDGGTNIYVNHTVF